MILFVNDTVFDAELDHLSDLFSFLDTKLVELCDISVECEDPDTYGFFDRIEYLSGFGLVALQAYITETSASSKLKKHESFRFGPKTKSGVSKIKILNAVANFWKHKEEWIFEGGRKREEAIDSLFSEVGYSTNTDYPISGVLTELLTPSDVRFKNLLPLLLDWRSDMIKEIWPNQAAHTTPASAPR